MGGHSCSGVHSMSWREASRPVGKVHPDCVTFPSQEPNWYLTDSSETSEGRTQAPTSQNFGQKWIWWTASWLEPQIPFGFSPRPQVLKNQKGQVDLWTISLGVGSLGPHTPHQPPLALPIYKPGLTLV